MTASKLDFQRRLERALTSPRLAAALSRALPAARRARAERRAQPDWTSATADLAARRRVAIDDLPRLIERFSMAAEAAGAKVHHAADADEARRIVATICRSRRARLVVKTRSLVAQEIRLSEHLRSTLGLDVVEADYADWLLRLAGERASHIATPAVHKTEDEITELLERAVRTTDGRKPADLEASARAQLREAASKADVAITGAAALIADSGTVVLAGGDRDEHLPLPETHITLVGIDKVVRTTDDALALLRVLAPDADSNTGGAAEFIVGPNRAHDRGDAGDRKALHVVLVDNGRSAMRDHERFRTALSCIECGACEDACPSYEVVGGHVFGHIYTGPIGAVVSPSRHGVESVAMEQGLCMGCNACDRACPVDIPLASLIEDVRAQAVGVTGLALGKRLVLSQMTSPQRLDRAAKWSSLAQHLFQRGPMVRLPFGAVAQQKSLTALSDHPLHYRAREIAGQNPAAPTARVGLFPSCLVDRVLPGAGFASARVLQALGCAVHLVEARRCCGQPHVAAGDRANAVTMAKDAIAGLEKINADHLVTPSSSCGATIAKDYPRLLEDEPEWQARAIALAERMVPFTPLAARLARERGTTGRRLDLKATYHDACQSANVFDIHDDPRALLRNVAGVEIVEMAESSTCCGFGGTFSFEYPEVANRVLERKLTNIAATEAAFVITDDAGCLTQLRGGLDARNRPLRVRHIAEILWESLEPRP